MAEACSRQGTARRCRSSGVPPGQLTHLQAHVGAADQQPPKLERRQLSGLVAHQVLVCRGGASSAALSQRQRLVPSHRGAIGMARRAPSMHGNTRACPPTPPKLTRPNGLADARQHALQLPHPAAQQCRQLPHGAGRGHHHLGQLWGLGLGLILGLGRR
jgi:hypothetical protein